MNNQLFNPNPDLPRLPHRLAGVKDPNQDPDVNAVDLAHPGAPSEFRDRTHPVNPKYDRPQYPGSESAGPAMFNLVEETARAIDIQSRLIAKAIPLLTHRIIVEKHSVQTDANGNADLVLYRVQQGMQFVMTRCVVEDAAHNAGTPFAVAAAWHAIIEGDKYQPGSIRDFAPNPPASNIPCIPWVYSDGNEESAVFRGGQIVSLHLALTNTFGAADIWVSLQGHEFPV